MITNRPLFFLLLSLIPILFLLNLWRRGSTLGQLTSSPTPVKVTASIPYCPLLYITPQNRLPPTDNNSLELTFDIRPLDVQTSIFSTTVTTDSEGKVRVCPIDFSLITARYYDIYIKGYSHLTRRFPHIFFGGAGFILDLKDPPLLAGDSSLNSDDYVNSLDISYEISHLYTNDLRADLNRDTIVNSLEFPTLISHLYQHGDI